MADIPVYMKKDPQMPRPNDPEFFWVTREGTFFCRNHGFFSSDVRSRHRPTALAPHSERCWIRYPKLGQAALEFAVGFFDFVYQQHGSEAIVLLFWDLINKRYKLWVPEQKPTVWESYSGLRTAMDVAYEAPLPPPRNHLLVGDIHSHGDLEAYSSNQDRNDELYRDGVHVVVGRIEQEPPQFHLEFAVDGQRFMLKFDSFLRGYQQRRRIVPQTWVDKVTVNVKRPLWYSLNTNQGSWSNQRGN